MKVLSIREPFATLISLGIKKVETRSWKTNYRGELYIHACGVKLEKRITLNDYIMSLIIDKTMMFGNIICKCKLVDCVYMTEEYINSIKDTPEYKLGHYEVGRYAWILEDVEIITPISTKGKLGIWRYN